MARLLPPESADVVTMATETGVMVKTLERWREEVITTAALDEVGKSAWCREHGLYPTELEQWRLSATTALAEPAAMMQAFRAFRRCLLLAGVVLANQAAADACAPFIEEHPASASFRPHSTAFEACSVDEIRYRQVIADWLLQRQQTSPSTTPDITSLSLGRAVNFPWISRFIADAALRTPGWAVRVARAKIGERDKLARPVLHDPALLHRLAVPFADSRYEVIGLSYEKVLFGRADQHASPAASNQASAAVKVPYDAQLWLRLAPRKTSAPVAE